MTSKAYSELPPEPPPGPPEPLFRPLGEPETFPLDALPPILQDGVRGVVGRVQCPEALAAQSIIAASALAAQAHVDVELHTGQRRPVSLFLLTVAQSGERKTSADAVALASVSEFQNRLRTIHAADLDDFRIKQTAWEVREKKIKSKGGQSVDQIENSLRELGPPPAPPLDPMLRCDEPTYEGLWLLLKDGPGTCGVFSAEGGQFIGGHAMNKENKLKTATAMSGLWDGAPINRVRRGDGVTELVGRRVSLHLMVQPLVASKLLCDEILLDQGLLSRILVASPISTMGTRIFRELDDETEIAFRRYTQKLATLIEIKPPSTANASNELDPRVLKLSSDARCRLIAFGNEVEAALAEGGGYRPISGFANKLAEHAARLAGVFQFVTDQKAQQISAEVMAGAIRLSRWYAGEALRLFNAGQVSPALVEADRARLWLINDWKESYISASDLKQYGPNAIREKAKAESVIEILEAHRWLWPAGNQSIRGKNRQETWRIIPEPDSGGRQK